MNKIIKIEFLPLPRLRLLNPELLCKKAEELFGVSGRAGAGSRCKLKKK